MRRIALVVLLFLLAACTAETARRELADMVVEPTAIVTAVPPTVTVVTEVVAEPTAVPTDPLIPTESAPVEPTQLPPTESPPTEAVKVEAEVVVEYGRAEEGAYFHGAANAPVTLIDYSDFL